MKLIKPSEISGRILSLLEESEEMVILVSPYMKISKWYKIVNKIDRLKTRRIHTEIYVRNDPDNEATYRDLDRLGLQYKKIPHLHSKLYLNERNGIVTSMNLLLSSEINSLEIAYATETWEEYNYLLAYYYRYIYSGEPVRQDESAVWAAAALKEMRRSISEALRKAGKSAWPWLSENILHVSTGSNSYSVSISDGYLRIIARLRKPAETKQKSRHHALTSEKILRDLTTLKVTLYPNFESDIQIISGQAHNKLESSCIAGILDSETEYIIKEVVGFIDVAENLMQSRLHTY